MAFGCGPWTFSYTISYSSYYKFKRYCNCKTNYRKILIRNTFYRIIRGDIGNVRYIKRVEQAKTYFIFRQLYRWVSVAIPTKADYTYSKISPADLSDHLSESEISSCQSHVDEAVFAAQKAFNSWSEFKFSETCRSIDETKISISNS